MMVSYFLDSAQSQYPGIGVCTSEEAVISSRLYELTGQESPSPTGGGMVEHAVATVTQDARFKSICPLHSSGRGSQQLCGPW